MRAEIDSPGTAPRSSRDDFEQGVRDLVQAEATFPGSLRQFLTHPIDGLENFEKMLDVLTNAKHASVRKKGK